MLKPEKLERALVIQTCIFNRTQVHMPIGKVLKEMGVLSQEQVDSVLQAQRSAGGDSEADNAGEIQAEGNVQRKADRLALSVSKDSLAAYLSPGGTSLQGVTLKDVKEMLTEHGIVYGVVGDQTLTDFLNSNPLPVEPFRVAYGKPPKEGRPPEIRYHFDTDPLRVGTVLAAGQGEHLHHAQTDQPVGDAAVDVHQRGQLQVRIDGRLGQDYLPHAEVARHTIQRLAASLERHF